MGNNKDPNQKRPGEKEPGTFHFNPGNMSGKTSGPIKKEEDGKTEEQSGDVSKKPGSART